MTVCVPLVNICEQCDNFMPATEFTPALQAQLADIIQLRNDAQRRGWASELERHSRVIARLEQHLTRLAANLDLRDLLDPPTVAG